MACVHYAWLNVNICKLVVVLFVQPMILWWEREPFLKWKWKASVSLTMLSSSRVYSWFLARSCRKPSSVESSRSHSHTDTDYFDRVFLCIVYVQSSYTPEIWRKTFLLSISPVYKLLKSINEITKGQNYFSFPKSISPYIWVLHIPFDWRAFCKKHSVSFIWYMYLVCSVCMFLGHISCRA